MSINWFTVNVPTILPVPAATWGIVTYLNNLDNRVRQGENYRITRGTQTDKNFVDLTAVIHTLQESSNKQDVSQANITYRMGQMEATVAQQNARMDRIADSVLDSVERIKKDLGGVSTKVEVLNQKVDSLDVPRTRRSVMPLLYEECIPCRPLRIAFSIARPFP